MSMNQLAAGTNAPAHSVTPVLIPDAEGQYGRGFRDCLESFKLAAASLSIPTSQVDQVVATLHDAYSNNADRAIGEEVSESLVVSTWHVHPDEREMLSQRLRGEGSRLIVTMSGDCGWLIHVPSEDALDESVEDWLTAEQSHWSAGFFGVLRRAVELGVQHIRFDRDAPTLDGVVGYADDGTPENWSL